MDIDTDMDMDMDIELERLQFFSYQLLERSECFESGAGGQQQAEALAAVPQELRSYASGVR